MKKIYLYITILITALVILLSCSNDDDSFVNDKNAYTGNPGHVDNITYESLPGQIRLNWDVPADSSYQYVKIKYYDHLKKENVTLIASIYTNSILIDETRQKFGDYEFSFQAFNAKHKGGETKTIKAQSGRAPVIDKIVETKKIPLTVDQLSTNALEKTEGSLGGSIDDDPNTYFHSDWRGRPVIKPHYFEIHLKEPLTTFQIYCQNAPAKKGSFMKDVDIMISNNGTTWQTLVNLKGQFPTQMEPYITDEIKAESPFTYLRWSVNISSSGATGVAWTLGTFIVYQTVHDIYDPEASDA